VTTRNYNRIENNNTDAEVTGLFVPPSLLKVMFFSFVTNLLVFLIVMRVLFHDVVDGIEFARGWAYNTMGFGSCSNGTPRTL
jgi:hypothetical protein